MTEFDVAVIGAGIAGASVAAEISGSLSVVLLEAEAQPGYHSTGRSAAFWTESYGGPLVQPLTTASGPFLAKPPIDFSNSPLMTPRGALHIGTSDDQGSLRQMRGEFSESGVRFDEINREKVETKIPGLRCGWTEALWEPDCCDIDVAALHQSYLRQAKRQASQLRCNTRLHRAKWLGNKWHVETGADSFSASIIVNAAGAWADEVAVRCGVEALDIIPFRRTVVQLATTPTAPADLPLVIGLNGSFYFKPAAAGKVWLSPHDETRCLSCDAAPEELDVALAIDRFQNVVDWEIARVEHKWAGLRSFAPDRLPVIGRDTAVPEFFWFAGQGGFGIQTAPAAAKLAASLLLRSVSTPKGVMPELYSPTRFD